jgi:hypothetical protein
MFMSDVLDFLKANVGRVFKVREISKEVNEDLFKRDTTWAASDLKRLCSKGLIEAINGCYWVPPEQEKEEAEPEHAEEADDEIQTSEAPANDAPKGPESGMT